MSRTGDLRGGRRQDGGTRAALIRSGIALMRANPWQRASAKAIAEAAGLDPALVTYHFGGRSGLVATIAAEVASELAEQMSMDYDSIDDVEEALHAAVSDPIKVLAKETFFTQLWVRELLLHSDDQTDVLVHDLAVPYFAPILTVIDRAKEQGALVNDGDGILPYTLTAVAQLRWFLEPWISRTRSAPGEKFDAEPFAWHLTDILLHGVLSRGGRRSALGQARRTKQPDHPSARRPSREDLIESAVDLLRKDPQVDLTLRVLSQATGTDLAYVQGHFSDTAALMTDVARRAATMLAQPAVRRRGRPSTQNPELERDLIRSAIELIEQRGKTVPARAIAARAGCDPAVVTYYFEGRRGLYQAVAEMTVTHLISVFEEAWSSAGSTHSLRSGLVAVTRELAERPNMSEFLLDEMLVQGTPASDQALVDVAAPYFQRVKQTIDREMLEGRFRALDRDIALYALGVIPLFMAAIAPVLHRTMRSPTGVLTSRQLSENLVALLFEGALGAAA